MTRIVIDVHDIQGASYADVVQLAIEKGLDARRPFHVEKDIVTESVIVLQDDPAPEEKP